MRELKFRAWDNHKKEWLMGYQFIGGFSLIGELVACSEWQAVLCDMVRGEFGEHGEHLIIQQFTGIKDRGGKEIYEGDIVNVMGDFTASVIYSERYSSFEVATTGNSVGWWGEDKLEVVGNINENPELCS